MTESQIQLWDALLHALQNNNVQAALRVVRNGESSAGDDEAYKALYGWKPGNGKVFDSFDDHPRKAFQSQWGWTSAAGAYQAMCAVPGYVTTDTWGDFIRDVGPRDFSPASQDAFGAWCFRRRGALQDVIAGRIREAIRKCRKEWASLPDAGYGQPEKSLEEALEIYKSYGGIDAEEPAANGQIDSPVPVAADPPPVAQPQVVIKSQAKEVPTMGVLAALLPAIFQMLPQLIPVLSQGHDSPEAKQWQGAGTVIANTLQTATNTDNIVQAVAAMQTNPDALAAAHAAVNDILPQLVESGGGGIQGARESAGDPSRLPFWKQQNFWITISFLPLVYAVVLAALVNVPWLAEVTSETRSFVIGFVLGSICAAILAYNYGTTSSSAKKTDALISK